MNLIGSKASGRVNEAAVGILNVGKVYTLAVLVLFTQYGLQFSHVVVDTFNAAIPTLG